MEHRLVHHLPVAEMLDDDALEQCGRHSGVPNSFRVDDDDRSAGADAEARRLAALDPPWPEEQSLAMQQASQFGVQHAPFAIRRAKAPHADENVVRVRLHDRVKRWDDWQTRHDGEVEKVREAV